MARTGQRLAIRDSRPVRMRRDPFDAQTAEVVTMLPAACRVGHLAVPPARGCGWRAHDDNDAGYHVATGRQGRLHRGPWRASAAGVDTSEVGWMGS